MKLTVQFLAITVKLLTLAYTDLCIDLILSFGVG